MALRIIGNVYRLQQRGVSLLRPPCCTLKAASLISFVEQFKEQTKATECLARTHESDPGKHTMRHEGLYYTIDKDTFNRLAWDKNTSKHIASQVQTFQEACLMVRKPALEIIHTMKHMNSNHPVIKFVLYGHRGCGKTLTLFHVMHYCMLNKWCILSTPWPLHWIEWYHEISNSSHVPGRIDLPVEAKAILEGFLKLNGNLLDNFVTQYRYEWTKRETTEIGTPLTDLIHFGLTRVKFADDVVGALLKEIKYLASQNKLKVLIVLDGINAYFKDTHMNISRKQFKDTVQAKEKEKRGKYLHASELSLVSNFKKILHPDMLNSVLVSTVDYNLNSKDDRDITTPTYLLGKEGFQFLDPFIPIEVTNYSDKEAFSCLEYFIDRKWIINPKGHTEEGKKQLLFLSNKHPKNLYKVCAAW